MGGLAIRQWYNQRAFAAHRAASCIGKTAYVTKADAVRVLTFRSRRGKANGLKAYRCDCCKQWHLGGRP